MEVCVFKEELIKDVIYYEVQCGGQVFFVYNCVKSLVDMVVLVCCLVFDVDVVVVYG